FLDVCGVSEEARPTVAIGSHWQTSGCRYASFEMSLSVHLVGGLSHTHTGCRTTSSVILPKYQKTLGLDLFWVSFTSRGCGTQCRIQLELVFLELGPVTVQLQSNWVEISKSGQNSRNFVQSMKTQCKYTRFQLRVMVASQRATTICV